MRKTTATAASDATDTAISVCWYWELAVNAGGGALDFRSPRRSTERAAIMTPPIKNCRRKSRRIRNGSSSMIAVHTMDVLIAIMTLGT